jgi:subtilisin family serine protease
MKNVKDGLLGSTSPVHRSIHHIWPDFEVKAQLTKTISTVKADAAQKAFGAFGKGIVWAVMDSGIDVTHPHFNGHANVQLEPPFAHKSFCDGSAEEDPFGHGTHVAGIIAGVTTHGKLVLDGNGKMVGSTAPIVAISRRRTPDNGVQYDRATDIKEISGISPETKLISLKVLDEFGNGRASSIIAAIDYVQQINGYGREILIHGVNMSVGYDFEPEWFACGQSPLCVEVNRLVRSGVVVVVAAGNTGFGSIKSEARGVVSAGIGLTINDPGNADLAITVGSTHREMPHRYGVSYFSSKGPTGDGRLKPDLLAPGEKILSCAAGQKQVKAQSRLDDQEQGAKSKKVPDKVLFVEDSGTSMAAPHVSGVIAAFLSIRKEFIGQPEKVKEIFMETATDLHRERTFQGAGLIDLMRAIQSV